MPLRVSNEQVMMTWIGLSYPSPSASRLVRDVSFRLRSCAGVVSGGRVWLPAGLTSPLSPVLPPPAVHSMGYGMTPVQVVEPIRRISREERRAALVDAGWNPFLLKVREEDRGGEGEGGFDSNAHTEVIAAAGGDKGIPEKLGRPPAVAVLLLWLTVIPLRCPCFGCHCTHVVSRRRSSSTC